MFKNSSLSGYKVENGIYVTNEIKLMSIEDLIKLSNEYNIDTVFYYYDFIDEYYFMINDETTAKLRLDETALSVLKDKIDKHNENLSKLDYDKPTNLSDFL